MKSDVFSRCCQPTSCPKNMAVPPSWQMPASKLTRVLKLCFSKSMAKTLRANQSGRLPLANSPWVCSASDRIAASSCWVMSKSESRCLKTTSHQKKIADELSGGVGCILSSTRTGAVPSAVELSSCQFSVRAKRGEPIASNSMHSQRQPSVGSRANARCWLPRGPSPLQPQPKLRPAKFPCLGQLARSIHSWRARYG